MNTPMRVADFVMAAISMCIFAVVVVLRERHKSRSWEKLATEYHLIIVGVVAQDPFFGRVALRIAKAFTAAMKSQELAPWENSKVLTDEKIQLN